MREWRADEGDVVRRRRNKVVLWEWSRDGHHANHSPGDWRTRPLWPQALGAAALLGVILFVLSQVPRRSDGYSRARLGGFICESAGVEPGAALCLPVSVGGWFAIVISIGAAAALVRRAVAALAPRRDSR